MHSALFGLIGIVLAFYFTVQFLLLYLDTSSDAGSNRRTARREALNREAMRKVGMGSFPLPGERRRLRGADALGEEGA